MPSGLYFRIEATKVEAKITNVTVRIYDEVRSTLITSQYKLLTRIQAKLSGEVLNQRRGRLLRSVQAMPLEEGGGFIIARVRSVGNIPYAAIHEYGGIIQHPGGTAYMYIEGTGVRWVSNARAQQIEQHLSRPLPRTRAHPIPIPERSYMRSSLREEAPEFQVALRDAIVRGSTT